MKHLFECFWCSYSFQPLRVYIDSKVTLELSDKCMFSKSSKGYSKLQFRQTVWRWFQWCNSCMWWWSKKCTQNKGISTTHVYVLSPRKHSRGSFIIPTKLLDSHRSNLNSMRALQNLLIIHRGKHDFFMLLCFLNLSTNVLRYKYKRRRLVWESPWLFWQSFNLKY